MICDPCYRACFGGQCRNKRCECLECGGMTDSLSPSSAAVGSDPDPTASTNPERRCENCGHDSPHVQQHGDECFCGCVDYTTGGAA